ncbi:hypothetical protein [Xanthomonas phage f20-Xaj]|uniref:Uncharacterized protein n=1 Tax=Xanthomonas phage f20-Xaj TaxID=1784979 RepID=A0A127AY85_9CAUD|nr:hypothetical protein FDI07_gp11 [Xanthomonas phage f20-Xaj]AMM44651.1 hypothetical protein [Xanthomonas phage f20-Xaj]
MVPTRSPKAKNTPSRTISPPTPTADGARSALDASIVIVEKYRSRYHVKWHPSHA